MTKIQIDVLEYIIQFAESEGCFPTFREIRNSFGYRSINSVTKILASLKELGYLEKDPLRNSRCYTPLKNSEGLPVQWVLKCQVC